jgi:hypothetical protein
MPSISVAGATLMPPKSTVASRGQPNSLKARALDRLAEAIGNRDEECSMRTVWDSNHLRQHKLLHLKGLH